MSDCEPTIGEVLTELRSTRTELEAKLTALSVGQDSLMRGVQRITDILAEHTAALDDIERRLSGIETTLAAILAKLP